MRRTRAAEVLDLRKGVELKGRPQRKLQPWRETTISDDRAYGRPGKMTHPHVSGCPQLELLNEKYKVTKGLLPTQTANDICSDPSHSARFHPAQTKFDEDHTWACNMNRKSWAVPATCSGETPDAEAQPPKVTSLGFLCSQRLPTVPSKKLTHCAFSASPTRPSGPCTSEAAAPSAILMPRLLNAECWKALL